MVAQAEAVKVEQSLRMLSDTAEEVQAVRTFTKSAIGFESQAAESLKLAYAEAEQAESIQEARGYQESNVTAILHEVVQQLQLQDRASPATAEGRKNAVILQSLQKAESAQAAMIEDASQEDQALASLRQTMASAAQSATTAKLIDETRSTPTLNDAVERLQEIQRTQLAHGKQTVLLAKSIEGLGEDKEHAKEVASLQAELESSKMHAKQVESELTTAHAKATSDHEALLAAQKKENDGLDALQQVKAETDAAMHKAVMAREQATIMYEAAAIKQKEVDTQSRKAARSLLTASQETAATANALMFDVTVSPPPT